MEKYRNFRLCGYVFAYYLENAELEQIQRDIDYCRQYTAMDKVYLETHRGLTDIPKEKMLAVKELFLKNGFEVSGGITATVSIGDRPKPAIFDTFCFSDPRHRERFLEIVRYTAGLFDEIILDDFFFTSCRCKLCIEAKGERTWEEFKLAQMEEFSREAVAAAKEVNPNCNFIIKYPNWYESYQTCGYNPGKQKDIFDMIYTGTESRAPGFNDQHLQRYLSYSLVRYLSNVAPGRNGGGWIDLGGASGAKNMWLEQANLTLFAKARELMLFNFASVTRGDSLPPLGTDLRRVDALLDRVGSPVGVSAYEPYDSDGEDQLMNYIGMCGIPFEPKPEFDENARVLFLAENAAHDPEVMTKLKKYVADGGRAVITTGFVRATWEKGIRDMTSVRPTGRRVSGTKYLMNYFNIHNGNVYGAEKPATFEVLTFKTNATWADVLLCVDDYATPVLTQDYYGDGILNILNVPDGFGDLYRLPGEVWDFIAKVFARGGKVYLGAEPKASIFEYDNDVFAVYNYHAYSTPIELTLIDEDCTGFEDMETGARFTEPHHKNPQPIRVGDSATFRPEPLERVFRLGIAPGEFKFYKLLRK